MKILYFDCFSGISGDMTLGAFLDLGVDEKVLKSELSKLNLGGYKIEVSKKSKNGIMATDVDVILENDSHKHEEVSHEHNNDHYHKHEHHHRTFNDIKGLIENSSLVEKVKELSINIFYSVAKAEGKIHGKNIEEVHFHEVGAIDSIIDIVGAAICLNELNIDRVVSSKVHIGMGSVKCQHGIIPVPAPATLEILKEGNVPIYTTGITKEIVTPTGAAIISTLAENFINIPSGVVEKIGYGSGKRDMEIANVLRLIIINEEDHLIVGNNDDRDIIVLETNIDDMTGEFAGFTMEKLFEVGALDVFYTPIQMKKNRPAFKLTVIVNEEDIEKVKKIIFNETTTIGLRMYKAQRECMKRKIESIETPYGYINIKISTLGDIIKITPEYEDCRRVAMKNNVSLNEIYNYINREKEKIIVK